MSFVSWQFLIFFPIVLLLYYSIPVQHRWKILLPASFIFFLTLNVWHGFLLVSVILISYFFALLIDGSKNIKIRLLFLSIGILSSISILLYFKYAAWFVNNFTKTVNYMGADLNWVLDTLILPLGISFFTLQAVGYLFDVYRKNVEVERNLARYALFISFFPQLVAGPIERAKHILPQLKMPLTYDYDEFKSGLKLISWGVFKKVVVADNMARIVDPIYNNPHDYTSPILLLATVAFAIQIYCDFSGYTDIAIGLARTLGINLMKNFNNPYFALTISDFWRRWHISLSTWFRDYLYVPLGGNKTSLMRWAINIFIVFVVSGVWHGAQLTFVIWGALHAFYFLISRWLAGPAQQLINIIGLSKQSYIVILTQILLTFSLVTLAWVFFRANSVADGLFILKTILFHWPQLSVENITLFSQTINTTYLLIAFSAATILFVIEYMQYNGLGITWFNRQSSILRWSTYYVWAGLIILFGNFGHSSFIYFQF
jgi:alginate O-acetyltransferase complex protein AlgI